MRPGLKPPSARSTLADGADADDLVLVLMSGGASANWIAPAAGLSLRRQAGGDARAAALGRQHRRDQHGAQTSLAHQGRTAGARARIRRSVVTLAISDVPGDDPAVIGSGPTVPDPTTLADARAIVARYRLDLPDGVTRALADPANETPKPGDPVFAGNRVRAGRAAGRCLPRRRGRRARRRLRMRLARRPRRRRGARRSRPSTRELARELRAQGRRAVILSGGELTVTIRGQGRGGPNQEYALALAIALDGAPAIAALAGDTDGTDGGAGAPDDPAGALIDGDTAGAGPGARPRSGRLSCRQQFDRLFRRASAILLDDRADLHQRQRLPRHRR